MSSFVIWEEKNEASLDLFPEHINRYTKTK